MHKLYSNSLHVLVCILMSSCLIH
uniref:Uncharacterized protein n=1 Tax=Arundo donax TaxID=35708 RepID=A0A0A8Z5N1_ARUDO